MQVKKSTPARSSRRSQVVQAYIEVVAEEGYDVATFARLAKRAGLSSTRLISYHFDDKDELVAAAVEEIYLRIRSALAAREPRPGETELASYVRAAIALNTTIPAEMRALAATFLSHRPASEPVYDADRDTTAVGRVLDILRRGQASGVLRDDFDPLVVATTVQRSVDALPFTVQQDPALDLEHWGDELVTMFDRATRASA